MLHWQLLPYLDFFSPRFLFKGEKKQTTNSKHLQPSAQSSPRQSGTGVGSRDLPVTFALGAPWSKVSLYLALLRLAGGQYS